MILRCPKHFIWTDFHRLVSIHAERIDPFLFREKSCLVGEKTDVIYIFWTCRDIVEAKTIIHALLNMRLIACASILPEVKSIYRWEGKIEESKETKIIIKTQDMHFDAIQNHIQANCSYKVPEILQLDIIRGNPAYLKWVIDET
jgi:periplasmic divalent cation tolerance protein